MRLPTPLALAILLALALAPGTAVAVSVTLDFQGGVEIDPDPSRLGDEFYLEEGFAIRADGLYATNAAEAGRYLHFLEGLDRRRGGAGLRADPGRPARARAGVGDPRAAPAHARRGGAGHREAVEEGAWDPVWMRTGA